MRRFRIFFMVATLALLASCNAGIPTVQLLATASYADSEHTAEVSFYQLADASLSFIKVKKSDGTTVTLPQMVSASGTRFTDGFQDEFWFKGDYLYISSPDESGDWIAHSELKKTP